MTKDKKIYNQVKKIKEQCESWINHVDSLGNQCACTDREVEEILISALKLSGVYNENIVYWVDEYENEDLYQDGTELTSKKFKDYDKAAQYFEKKDPKHERVVVLSWSEDWAVNQYIIRKKGGK